MCIKCTMIECSNKESVGYKLLNITSNLYINTRFEFGTIRSSKIKNIEFDEDLIIIVTRNTKYIFKIEE